MNIYKTALFAAFGRGGALRLIGLAVLAFGCSAIFAQATKNLVLPLSNDNFLVCSATFAIQSLVFLTLLLASGQKKRSKRFATLLLTWPISARQRWLILLAPELALILLSLALTAWPLGIIFDKLGLAPALFLLSVALGCLSAFGVLHILSLRRFKQLACIPVLILEYMLVRYTLLHHAAGGVIVFFAIVVGLTYLAISSANRGREQLITSGGHGQLYTRPLPVRFWFYKIALRDPSTRLSFGAAAAIAVGLASLSRTSLALPPEGLALFCSMVIATFVSDIRSLARRLNPTEIAGLRGTLSYATSEWKLAASAAPLIAGPLLWIMINGGMRMWQLVVPPALGIGAGLFAGTLVAADKHDVTGQFLATLLVIGILGILPLIFHSSQPWPPLAMSSGLCLLALGIEYRRNQYIWRKRHV